MADWEENSPVLQDNLKKVLAKLRDAARRREPLSVSDAKAWHTEIMKGLQVPDPVYVGNFRGEPGLEQVKVFVDDYEGTPASDVSIDLGEFDIRLKAAIARLDELIPSGELPGADYLDAVLDVCGWAHAEWVRIHPFANGNGRTARLWANYIAMRYGLPPFVRLRPRPDGNPYGDAAKQAMQGNWLPTAELFRVTLDEFLAGPE